MTTPSTHSTHTLLDRCLHHVRSATEALLQGSDPGTRDLLAARRCLEVQSILQDCGAHPLDDDLVDVPAAELIERARQDLNDLGEEGRPPRVSSAHAELALIAADLATAG